MKITHTKCTVYLLCAPQAPNATAEAPDRPANRTKGDPCMTNLSNVGISADPDVVKMQEEA